MLRFLVVVACSKSRRPSGEEDGRGGRGEIHISAF